jgi:uncharacterized protein YndB with AHSA1/START domain
MTHHLTIEGPMKAAPEVLYAAWTTQFDHWFAVPGTVLMQGLVNTPFFFETEHGGTRQPHYGRFLHLEPNRLIALTWLTSATLGTETIVTVQLTPHNQGTHLKLTHAGFPDEETRDRHQQAWPLVLEHLDERMTRANRK